VPIEEKKSRLRALELLQESIVSETNGLLLGTPVEVLVEDRQKGQWRGRTRSDKLVFFHEGDDMVGKVVDVKISRTGPWSLEGELIGAETKI
jgi:tRNA-2-methylthio-N6-dimethylallyladenosine synthase